MADISEEFDFMHGSMKDLAMRMGEIDDVLAEIAAPEETKHEKEKVPAVEDDFDYDYEENRSFREDSPIRSRTPPTNDDFENPAINYDDYNDYDDDDDSDDGGLMDLQGELQKFEELGTTEQQAAIRAECETIIESPVLVVVEKPTPKSPLGISMKTSKGITKVVGISKEGLLVNSDLKVGHVLTKINGTYIKNAKHARYIIQNAPDKVCLEGKQVTEL